MDFEVFGVNVFNHKTPLTTSGTTASPRHAGPCAACPPPNTCDVWPAVGGGGYGMVFDSNEQKELDQESWLEENNPHWGKSQACR